MSRRRVLSIIMLVVLLFTSMPLSSFAVDDDLEIYEAVSEDVTEYTVSDNDAVAVIDEVKDVAESDEELLIGEVKDITTYPDFNEYIPIHNRAELEAIIRNTNVILPEGELPANPQDRYKKYYLANDIDLGDEPWIPLGEDFGVFSGVLDGQGHKITNMKITGVSNSEYGGNYYSGLFAKIGIDYNYNYDSTEVETSHTTIIRNLIIEDATIIKGDANAYCPMGMVCGTVVNNRDYAVNEYDNGTPVDLNIVMDNIYTSGSINCNQYNAAGGIMGLGFASAVSKTNYTFNNCVSNVDIQGEDANIGGIVSIIGADEDNRLYSATFTNCKNYGELKGNNSLVGGIIDSANNNENNDNYIKLNNCHNYGNIVIDNGEAAGIVCKARNIELNNCSNNGNITNSITDYSLDISAGGIASYSGYSSFTGCTNNGQIVFTSSESLGEGNIGGIIGLSNADTIVRCDNKKRIESYAQYMGGIVGRTYYGTSIDNCNNINDIKNNNYGMYDGNSMVSNMAGGIAGYLFDTYDNPSVINNCYNCGNISSNSASGGIVALLYGSSDASFVAVTQVKECTNDGIITGEYGGGIVCFGYDMAITNCNNNADITNGAGIVYGYKKSDSYAPSSSIIQVENCINKGNISGCNAAGILYNGYSYYEDAKYLTKINACKNYGKITFDDTEETIISRHHYAGGIAGFAKSITNCINYGDIEYTGDSAVISNRIYVGGILGYNGYLNGGYINNYSNIQYCVNYGDIKVKAIDIVSGGIAGACYGDVLACANYGVMELETTTYTSSAYVGGILGLACTSEAGSLAGSGYGPSDAAKVYDCYNAGDINVAGLDVPTADDNTNAYIRIGGIAGYSQNVNPVNMADYVARCYSCASIDASTFYNGTVLVGEIVGEAGEAGPRAVVSAVALGLDVAAIDRNPSALLSLNYAKVSAIGIYVKENTDAAKMNYYRSDGIEGNSLHSQAILASKALDVNTYTGIGWDFDDVWLMPDDGTLPVLRFMNITSGPELRYRDALSLNRSYKIMYVGDELNLVVKGIDEDGTAIGNSDVTWSSSNTSVATVSSTGKVTAMNLGEAIITATYGEKIVKCKIQVEKRVINTPKENIVLNFYSGSGERYYNINLDWDVSYFCDGSDFYNNYLAIPALALSSAAEDDDYGQQHVENMLREKLGFETAISKRYSVNEAGYPAATYAYREITVRGKTKRLFAIVVRGTKSLQDISMDAGASVLGWGTPSSNIKTEFLQVASAMTGLSEAELNNDNADNILFITGHSYGGAVANRLSAELSGFANKNNIYTYTFASPLTTNGQASVTNAYNIINLWDDVPGAWTTTANKRFGTDYTFGTDYASYVDRIADFLATGTLPYDIFDRYKYNDEIQKYYKLITGGDIYKYTPLIGYPLRAHDTSLYMAYLLSVSDRNITCASSRCVKIVAVKCPVDVEVYDSKGNLVAKIVDNVVDNSLDPALFAYTIGDEKYISFPDYFDYTVKLVGTDTGKMEYDVDVVDFLSNEKLSSVSYKNVNLTKGKNMVSDIAKGTKDNPLLYVVDDNGNKIYVISTDGTETAVEKKYTIIFDSQGGSEVAPITDVKEGTTVKLPTTTKEGFIFAGWFTEKEGKGTKYTDATVITGDVTLYAAWSKNVDDPTNPDNPGNKKWLEKVVKISDTEYEINLATKEKYVFTSPVIAKESADGKAYKITETSADKKIAGVNKKGLFTAKKTGEATIAITKGQINYLFHVKVYNPKFTEKSYVMNAGESLIPSYEDCKLKPLFTVPEKQKKLVSVNPDTGMVTANENVKGTIKLTAMVGEGKNARKVTTSIRIYNPTLIIAKDVIKEGATTKAKIKNGVKLTTWKSSDESIATINSKGKITAIKAGKVTIEATNNGKVLTKEITVE